MRPLTAIVVIAALAVGGNYVYDASHIGAPPVSDPCPANHESNQSPQVWWVRDHTAGWVDPDSGDAQGVLEYHGWERQQSCAADIQMSGN